MNNTLTHEDVLPDTAGSDVSDQAPQFIDKLKQIASISQIVRVFGACAVIVSMSLFLLQGWSEGNDISRYLKLLAQTGLLTSVGLILSFIVKEYKGARVFFGLSLISVVANFTILGALTYSMVQWDGGLIDYPSMMKWVVIDPATFFSVFAGAAILLAVVSRFSFSIFARNIAGPLTLAFLGMCALLLIPVRSSLAVCLIAGASIWVSVQIVKRLRNNPKLVMTPETKAALGMLFLPAAIMITRALSLYHIDQIMLIGLLALTYSGIRALVKRVEAPTPSTRAAEIMQYGISVGLASLLVDLLPIGPSALNTVLFAALLLALVCDQLWSSKDAGWKPWLININAFMLVSITLLIALINSQMAWHLASLAIAGMVLLTTWRAGTTVTNTQVAQLSGTVGVLASVILLTFELVNLMNLSNWMLIGIIGVLLITSASLYERYGLSFSGLKLKKPS